MDQMSKSLVTTGATSIETMYSRINKSMSLVWLDERMDKNNEQDHCNALESLRQIVNTINLFTDMDQCIDFITDLNNEQIFVIVSKSFSQIIVPVVQNIPSVNCVYILDENKDSSKQWIQHGSKVKTIFPDIKSICETLKQAIYRYDKNSMSISFLKSTDEVEKKNLNQLDPSFMYTQILKEILLKIDFQQVHVNEFLTHCRDQYVSSTTRLKQVDKFEQEYHNHQPIWWYTSDYFLYPMLNRALRTLEVDVLIPIGFFIRDLHQHIIRLHSEQYGEQKHSKSFTIFRGQGLSQEDFDQLLKTSGGLISFNNFLSTSFDEAVSTAYASSNADDPNLVGILFKITVDPLIPSTPFCNVTDVSYFHDEGEILFSMHSVFRIGQVKQMDENGRLWQVDLTLTSDNDPQLHALTQRIREETFPGEEEWYRLGQVLIKLGEFKKAQQLYDALLCQKSDSQNIAGIYFQLGWIKDNRGEYAQALVCYKKLLEIIEHTLHPHHPTLAYSYNNLGLVYNKMGEYEHALFFHEKALRIREQSLPPNDSNLATSYNNIAGVYLNKGEYSKALSYYKKAFNIWQEVYPPHHPDLAKCHNNIAVVYININEFSEALSHFQRAHEIEKRSLPSNHPTLATSCNNIGALYGNIGEYSKAASYVEEALKILQRSVTPYDPQLATFYNNVASMYDKMNDHWKALFYFQTAHEIKKKTLLPNHLHLGASYNNMAGVYINIGKPQKALSYFKRAHQIFQKCLPPDHISFATLYSNIGFIYNLIGQFPEALLYYEKVRQICQNTLPENHLFWANFYNNIAGVYECMGNYREAQSYLKRALEVSLHTLPEYHPQIRTIRNNFEHVTSLINS